jgi:hypothetical protein
MGEIIHEVLNKNRGGSGAIITRVSDNVVRKTGSERIGLEGRWLRNNPAPSIVKLVGPVFDDEYKMELLQPRPVWPRANDYLYRIASILALDVWCKPAQHLMLNTIAHRDRQQPLLKFLGGSVIQFTQMYYSIPWQNLVLCRTHGDPIIDNVMSRDGDLVLIDPIPATQAIPDYLAVDVGRLLQSAVGYERARYNEGPEATEDPLDRIIEMAYSTMNHRVHKHEMITCYYFAVFHLLRACNDRRATPDTIARMQPMISRVLKEAEQWM